MTANWIDELMKIFWQSADLVIFRSEFRTLKQCCKITWNFWWRSQLHEESALGPTLILGETKPVNRTAPNLLETYIHLLGTFCKILEEIESVVWVKIREKFELRRRWSLASHEIIGTIQKFVSLLKPNYSAVTAQKDLKCTSSIQFFWTFLPEDIRKLSYRDWEIYRILFKVLDISNTLKFETVHCCSLVMLTLEWSEVSWPIRNKHLMMSWVGRATVNSGHELESVIRRLGNFDPINGATADTPLYA